MPEELDSQEQPGTLALVANKRPLNALVGLITSALRHSSIEDLLWDVVHKVVEVLAFEDCLIYLYDRAGGELVQKAAYRPKSPSGNGVLGPLRLKPGQGLIGSCAVTLDTIVVNDTRSDPRYLEEGQRSLSELCVPIVSDGNLIGVIDSESSRPDFYTDEHVQLLTSVAAIIATKFQGHEAIAELQQTVRRLERAERLQQALFNIAELVYTTDSLDDFYRHLHRNVVELIDAEVFFVALLDESGDFIDIPYPGDNETPYPMSRQISKEQFSNSLVARVIMQGKTLRASEEELDMMARSNKSIRYNWKACAWLGVPFVTPSGIRGAVGIQRANQKLAFNAREQELLTHISHHISNAIKRKQDEGALQRMALSDALTGLPNRTLLMDRLNHSLGRDKSVNDFQTHVFFIDLDRFKHINDAYGHHVGDEVLVEVGNRIRSCIRDSDTLGRISGDEFAVVLEDIDQLETLELVSRRIVDAFKAPVVTTAGEIKLSASIGVCSASEELCDAEELMKMADHAMYQAKATGQAEVVISSQSESQMCHARRVEAELAAALANEELELHFQPVFSLKDRLCTGFEVLTRWQHPELGLLYPDKFIDIAEKSGQIIALDSYVLKKSAELLHQWQQQNQPARYLNVNISGRTLISAGFVDLVQACYRDNGLAPGSLNIEMTEQCLISDFQGATVRLAELSKLGVRFFLDDFGTGYSSLKYLHQLPIDVLKIDRSFVQSLCKSDAAESIVKTIVMLANSLNIGIVAEGIEDESQIAALAGFAVHQGQGFLLGRPAPLSEIGEFLA